MKTILTSLFVAALSLGSVSNLANAAPGDSNDESRVEILDTNQGDCALRGAMCVTPGARSTVLAPSSPAAGLGSHAAAGSTPRLARTLLTAGRDPGEVGDEVPWTIEMRANLRHHALAGNAVFLVYDADNPKALANREVVGAWQATVPAGDTLSARMTLSPNDGFHADRTYRVRVVQIVNGKEIVLTDGSVRLL